MNRKSSIGVLLSVIVLWYNESSKECKRLFPLLLLSLIISFYIGDMSTNAACPVTKQTLICNNLYIYMNTSHQKYETPILKYFGNLRTMVSTLKSYITQWFVTEWIMQFVKIVFSIKNLSHTCNHHIPTQQSIAPFQFWSVRLSALLSSAMRQDLNTPLHNMGQNWLLGTKSIPECRNSNVTGVVGRGNQDSSPKEAQK